jgi:hypothetical protein
MINRSAVPLIQELAGQFPAVLILGPRQCGKTTLAKYFLKGEYFDLEKPSDQQIFLGDIEIALRQFDEPLIIDEAQILPDLFPVLRALIDEKRDIKGRYYLLGSVNPSLIKNISESLAGRVGMFELTPFLLSEIELSGIDLQTFWLKGGYPDAIKEREESKWQRWQENYVRAIIERDVLRHGPNISPIQMRRLLGMLSHVHGGLLNASELGRSLSISYHTVNSYLDMLEGHYLIRRLTPYSPNIGKRIVKSSKIYIRDTGILHYLLGISTRRNLLESPKLGASWEGMMIEQLIALERLTHRGSQFYFYRIHGGGEIDLIIDRGTERTGYEFKCAASANRKDWINLLTGIEDGIIQKGFVVNWGERNYSVSDTIEVVSAEKMLIDGPA